MNGFNLKAEQGEGKPFSLGLYREEDTTFKTSLVQTTDLVYMSHYKQMGFVLNCTRLYGLGERTRNLSITDGTYAIYAQ
jgi:hypothetical protein